MITKTQKKLLLTFISFLLLFILPITSVVSYFVLNRVKVETKTAFIQPQDTNTLESTVNGSYPIQFTKPTSDWKYRVLSDNSNFGKINTMVFEIYSGDNIMRVNIVEEDIKALRELERNGDQKLSVLDSVLEYQPVDKQKIIKVNDELVRVPNKNEQIILSSEKTIKTDNKLSYLRSLDLFPEHTAKYRNSRLRTNIKYYSNSENNYKILDSILTTLKLVDKNINP